MRLFVGIAIAPEVAAAIAAFVDRLRGRVEARWSAHDPHVTTKFIGDWPDARVGEIEAALAPIAHAPFDVAVRGLGFFPSARAPRIFWAGVDAPELYALAADTERALAPLGIAPETRAFTPHVTLARLGRRTSASAFATLDLATTFGRFRAEEVALYVSERGYRVLRAFPLRASPA